MQKVPKIYSDQHCLLFCTVANIISLHAGCIKALHTVHSKVSRLFADGKTLESTERHLHSVNNLRLFCRFVPLGCCTQGQLSPRYASDSLPDFVTIARRSLGS